MNFKRLNASKLAEAIGINRSTLYSWLQTGLPRNDDKTFDLPAVISWMIERESRTATPLAEGDSPALERYREARAAMAELDLKERGGELISLEDVTTAWAERVVEVAAGLEHFADRLPPLLEGKDRAEMRQIIGDEVWRLRSVYARNGRYCDAAAK